MTERARSTLDNPVATIPMHHHRPHMETDPQGRSSTSPRTPRRQTQHTPRATSLGRSKLVVLFFSGRVTLFGRLTPAGFWGRIVQPSVNSIIYVLLKRNTFYNLLYLMCELCKYTGFIIYVFGGIDRIRDINYVMVNVEYNIYLFSNIRTFKKCLAGIELYMYFLSSYF